MANHTDDCPHCGEDRRSVGSRCCAKHGAELDAKLAKFLEEQAARREVLETLGIGVSMKQPMFYPNEREIIPHEGDLWRFLRECVAARKTFSA